MNTPTPAPTTYLTFQHCKSAEVRHHLLAQVQNYKRVILQRVVSVFEDTGIPYSLDAGNLLETLRGEIIPQDDDLDVRFDHRHWDKWVAYCNSLQKTEIKGVTRYVDSARHLLFDARARDLPAQLYDGIQASLADLTDPLPVRKDCEPLHVDIVTSNPRSDFWPNVGYFFEEPLDKIEYCGIPVSIPNLHIRNQYLTQLYGKNYMSPDIPSRRDAHGYYLAT